MSKPSLPCDSCRAAIYPGDKFCDSCGLEVSEGRMMRLAEWERGEAQDAREAVLNRRSQVKRASRMLLLLALLFSVTGLGAYVFARETANKALRNLSSLPDDEVFPTPVGGVTYKVRDLRAKIDAEPGQGLALNLTLGLVLAALYFWSRRAPFPAIVTAIGTLVTV